MVKNIFSILTQRQTSILSGAIIIMATTILSKILGLVRDRLLAHSFTPATADIFFAAFRLPDMIFQILILGALSIAFIPVFTDYLQRKGQEEALKLASSILNLALLVLVIVVIAIFIFIGPLTTLIAPGFSDAQKLQTEALTKTILIGQFFLVIGSLFIGILQSFQRFIIPALAGVFYNLGIILGIVFLSPSLGIMGPAVGVIIGAVLHAAIQLPLIFSMGFKIRNILGAFHPGVKEIAALMSLRTLGLAAEQINDTYVLRLATLIAPGSVTYLTFAQHLQLVPVTLFGAALAQAALPVLSSEKTRGQIEEFKVTFLTTLHQIFFLTLPATAVLIILRIPAVRLVFGASKFDWEATVLTGRTLGFLAVGLAVQASTLLLIRSFYALKDTRTPVIISFISVTINIILSTVFIQVFKLDVWGLGLAFSISNIVSGVLLFVALHFKVGGFNISQLLGPLSKMLLATIIMGAALYIPIKLLDQVIFDTTRTVNLILLTGLASLFASSIYIILVWILRVKELATFLELAKGTFKSLQKSGTKLKSEEIIHDPESP